MHETVTTKIWKDTLYKLKVLAALTRSTMLETLDRLITHELERVQQHQQKDK